MCEVRDHDGSHMNGRVLMERGEGELLWEVEADERIVAADNHSATTLDVHDFEFSCRHRDGPWEPLELPPPAGKVLVIPAGSTIRAVPRDPDYVIPVPEPGGIGLRGMV